VARSSFLDGFTVADGASSGRADVEAEIGEAWGIVYAQGGVVMAAMMRAAELVLARDELRLSSAAATFCRPVPCGPVMIEVDVLRSGRNGAQVHATLRCAGDDDPAPNAVATVVCTAEATGWPEATGLVRPSWLATLPDDRSARLGTGPDGRPATSFYRETDWREAAARHEDPMRRLAWFSFTEPPLRSDGTWVPAMLAVPGDALGLAAVPPVSAVMGLLTAPSLQMAIELCAPARGRWLGIDSRCHHTHGALASGVATLWNADGSLVATVSQSAILRRLPNEPRNR
jgi:acyl-CoA thioesterase